MYDYLFSVIVYFCILPTGLSTEECGQAVFAKRDTLHVPEGSSLSLSCDIQHCGDTWTGKWTWSYSDKTDKKFIENSDRHSLTNVTLSANKTRLLLKFLSVNQSDEGFYGCMVTWGDQSLTGQGHFTYVNITAAVATKRNLLHRFLVCACAGLCALAILGLAHCLRSGVRPHLLPRTQFTYPHEYSDQPHSPPKPPPRRPVPKKRSNPSHKAPPPSEQKPEVVYADISQDALRQQGAIREPTPSTVYSSVRFS